MLGERDGWRCGLCGRKIDRRKRFPDPTAITIDHITPLSAGGGDELHNLQAAHWRCNTKRQASMNGIQYRLAI